jgi:hypothetical protein
MANYPPVLSERPWKPECKHPSVARCEQTIPTHMPNIGDIAYDRHNVKMRWHACPSCGWERYLQWDVGNDCPRGGRGGMCVRCAKDNRSDKIQWMIDNCFPLDETACVVGWPGHDKDDRPYINVGCKQLDNKGRSAVANQLLRIAIGPPPTKMVNPSAAHICSLRGQPIDNPACVNIAHLEWQEQFQNSQTVRHLIDYRAVLTSSERQWWARHNLDGRAQAHRHQQGLAQ